MIFFIPKLISSLSPKDTVHILIKGQQMYIKSKKSMQKRNLKKKIRQVDQSRIATYILFMQIKKPGEKLI